MSHPGVWTRDAVLTWQPSSRSPQEQTGQQTRLFEDTSRRERVNFLSPRTTKSLWVWERGCVWGLGLRLGLGGGGGGRVLITEYGCLVI